jgi:ribonuclease R
LEKELVLQLLREAGRGGVRMNDIASQLGLPAKARQRLGALLEELCESGDAEHKSGGLFAATSFETGEGLAYDPARYEPPRGPVVAGRIRVNPAGYGFVERDDGEEDVFVAGRNRNSAMDGDRVEVTTWMGHKGTEGRVLRVTGRGRAKLSGVLRSAGRTFYLEPDDPRVQGTVALEQGAGGAREGQAVVVEITRYPGADGHEVLGGRVIHVLGDPDDPRTEVEKVLICADIPDQFSQETLMAAARAPREVGPADLVDRADLRDRTFVTCDPETARDFDDAVCVEDRPGGGWWLWVAVADVSHYVPQGSALDREARARGCSVYLPNRAVPMLPHELSAGICSLNPEVDRCAMVCKLTIGPDGVPREPMLCAAVIRSRARLDYGGVAAALAGDFRGARARYRDHVPHLSRMMACAAALRKKREERGALDFDLEQAQVILDEDDPRRVRDVQRSKPSSEIKVAYGVVEDFMLAANEAVARYFRERKLDAVWRVHDKPDESRLQEFANLAETYGVAVRAAEATDPRVLRKTTLELRGHRSERALAYLLLRSLKQATYDVVNIGHFGLAAPEYVHFTSPIRRYPDLIVHRLLKRALHAEGLPSGGGAQRGTPPPVDVLAEMAAESSAHERRAMAAEREVVDMYRAYLMRDHVGEEFDGVVTGIAEFGIFVEIKEPFVEGMVRVQALSDDFYDFDPEAVRLVGRRGGRAFALGDEVRVRIENVSVARRRVELAMVAGGTQARAPSGPGRRRGSKRQMEMARDRERGGRRAAGRASDHSRDRDRDRGGPRKGGGKREGTRRDGGGGRRDGRGGGKRR